MFTWFARPNWKSKVHDMRKLPHYRRNQHPNSGFTEKVVWQLSKKPMTGRELCALFHIPLSDFNRLMGEAIRREGQTARFLATDPVKVGALTDRTYTLERKPKRVTPAHKNDCRVSYKQMGNRNEESRQKCIEAAKVRAKLIKAGINPGCLE